MILQALNIDPHEWERRTGWQLKPQGACKGDRCVPLPPSAREELDVPLLARRLGMPLVHDDTSGLWALGPEAGGRTLSSARAPDFILPEVRGRDFRLSSLRGSKVLLVAWASW